MLQDRVGRPVDTQAASAAMRLSLDQIRGRAKDVEDGLHVTLYVSGMTCRGCAWLIERIAARAPCLQSAAVSLTSGRIELVWREGFDFDQFQVELGRFGYALSDVGLGGLSLSPLAVRLVLSGLFSVNGLCVLLLQEFAIGGDSLHGLYQLLLFANLFLLILVGSAVYIRPAWDAIRIGGWHGDIPIAALHFMGFIVSLGEVTMDQNSPIFTMSFLLAVPAFLLARLMADHWEMSSRGRVKTDGASPDA